MWVHELTFPSFRLIICLIQVCLGGKGCSRQAWCSAHPFAAWFQHLPSGQFQVVHVTVIRTIKNYMPWWSLFAVLTSKLLRTMPYVGTTQKSNGNNTSRVQGWLSLSLLSVRQWNSSEVHSTEFLREFPRRTEYQLPTLETPSGKLHLLTVTLSK